MSDPQADIGPRAPCDNAYMCHEAMDFFMLGEAQPKNELYPYTEYTMFGYLYLVSSALEVYFTIEMCTNRVS